MPETVSQKGRQILRGLAKRRRRPPKAALIRHPAIRNHMPRLRRIAEAEAPHRVPWNPTASRLASPAYFHG